MSSHNFFREWINWEINDPCRKDPDSSKYVSFTLIGDHKTFHSQTSGLGLTLNISSVENGEIDSISFPFHLQFVAAREKGGKETAKFIIEHMKKMREGIGKEWFYFKLFK